MEYPRLPQSLRLFRNDRRFGRLRFFLDSGYLSWDKFRNDRCKKSPLGYLFFLEPRRGLEGAEAPRRLIVFGSWVLFYYLVLFIIVLSLSFTDN